MNKWIYIVAISVGLAACNGTPTPEEAALAAGAEGTGTTGTAAAQKPTVRERVAAAVKTPKYAEVTIPAGTTLQLELRSDVGSDTSTLEQAVNASLRDAVTVDGRVALPAGSELAGVVTDVENSGRVKGRAHVAYRFNTVRAGGENYDIQTAAVSHLAPATKGEDATKIAIGAGAGAALGAILGGKDGAAKGAAVGGAGGTGVVLATKGKEIHVGSGADISTKLTAPVVVRIRL